MNGEKASVTEAKKPVDDGQGRIRSTISFPYTDLGAAIDLTNAIHSHVGLGACDEDQIAAWTGQSSKSSGFREQLRVSRMAGLLDIDGGKYKLTELGRACRRPQSGTRWRSSRLPQHPAL